MPDENGNLVKRIDMALHFMQMAAVHRVNVKFTLNEAGNGGYLANRETKTVTTRPIQNTGYYVSGLHEMGHLLGDCQGPGNSTLTREWKAWVWAKENAIVWTDTAERVMKNALTSYCNRANVLEMPDEFFDWVNVTREGMAPAEPVA